MKHYATGTRVPVAHGAGGKLVSIDTPLERFRRYCQFDATTGCVLWTGGTTKGRGNSAPYGSFWAEGRRWFAHRWAALHIHGLAIDGMHVDHCCAPHRAGAEPLPPNTLCVQHVQPRTALDNQALKMERLQYLLTAKGYQQSPPLFAELVAPAPAVPMHEPPAWLGVDGTVNSAQQDCPF